jgi:hypothetical protein
MLITMGGHHTKYPTEIPGEIRHGQSARLFSNAGGGSGNYKYSWTCIPPGTPPWFQCPENPIRANDTSSIIDVVITSINNHDMSLFKIYPNPVKDCFTVEFADFTRGDFIMKIFSADGKLERVLNFNSNGYPNEQKVDVSDLTAGIYFLLIIDKFGTYVQKLVKI